MESVLKKYVNFSLFNLAIVALFGVIMRYKIGFEFPLFDQKNLQHAHSHFAFAGWISHSLMLLIINLLFKSQHHKQIKRYIQILNANLFCAYGMLISFAVQGYGPVSIFFSTATILVSYYFAYCYFKDIRKLPIELKGKNWFSAAIIINVLSSLGTFVLAYMMTTKNIPQNWYLTSIYYYLHFQYNGWFFFACAGLFFNRIYHLVPGYKEDKQVFTLFAVSCVPAYFLSTLWLKIPIWLYVIVIIASILQFIAWLRLVDNFRKHIPQFKEKTSVFIKYLVYFIALALTVKLALQLFSTIPYISKLAFGFRTIIIAYLHLVLLAIISVFILAYMFQTRTILPGRFTMYSMIIFTIGIILNEFILLIQGVASFSYTLIPYGNEALFVVALILFFGVAMMLIGNLRARRFK